MWVCVSNNHLSMVEIMKKAIESATRNPPANIITNLQEELKDTVGSKKCLVLDDVWDGQLDHSQQQWENFIGVVSEHAERGSKILITSQIESVAQVVLQGLPIKKDLFPLGCLEQADSFSLFYKHAFAGLNPDEHPNLKSVGKIITRKCGGLPLALEVIGRSLNKNLDHQYWASVSEKEVLNLDMSQGIEIPLKLSYQYLPSHLQSCFRFCSLFPRDYQFKKDELATLWMGSGIIQQSICENEDIVQENLDILVGRSFFMYNDQSKLYNMHDLVHDLARHVSEGEGLRIKGDTLMELPRSLRHLFVDGFNSNFPETISSLRKLRCLSLYSPERDLHDGFRGMHVQCKSLRSLVINTKTMPDLCAIELLKHLRVFDMRVRILDKPLKPLYKLYQLRNLRCSEVVKSSEADDACHQIKFGGMDNPANLRFLDLNDLMFDKLSNLVQLRYLDLPDSLFDKITELRYLTSLQMLKLHLRKDSKLKLCDLKNLNKLHDLSIIDKREKTSSEEAQEANLEDKPYLEILSLSLKWTNREPHLHKEVCNFLGPKKLSYIKDLKVTHYNGVEAPGWMTSDYLPCLTHLKLSQLNKLQHLPPLGKLPCLKVLSLQNIAGVKQSGTDFFASDVTEVFPSLEELRIENMENLEEWTRAEDTRWFPRLNKLYIYSCPQLKALPALPLSLKILNLKSVGLIALPAWQDANYHEESPALHDLRIDSCEKLVHFESFLSRCSSLEELWINQCLCDRAKAFSFYVGEIIDVAGER